MILKLDLTFIYVFMNKITKYLKASALNII